MAGLGTMTLYDARRLGRAWLRWVERTQKWADEAREFRRMRKGKGGKVARWMRNLGAR